MQKHPVTTSPEKLVTSVERVPHHDKCKLMKLNTHTKSAPIDDKEAAQDDKAVRIGEHKDQCRHREAADEQVRQQVRVLVPEWQVDARDLRLNNITNRVCNW